MRSIRKALCSLFIPVLAGVSPVMAENLPSPKGPVILVVTGAIEKTNAGDAAEFDIDMLRAIDNSEILTETIWTPDTHRFEGVRLDRLFEFLGARGEAVRATAINDYSVLIPLTDATEDGPIIAHSMDGKEMSRREKGPLWVIYPYSSSARYRSEVIYSRSIWQLDRLNFEE